MRLLDLPHGRQTVIDEADWPAVQPLTLYVGNNGYVYYSRWANSRSTPALLHRWLTAAPAGTHVDHMNGDKLDNRRLNLRVTTPQLNQVNRKRLNRNNTSGVRGVRYASHVSTRNPWLAQIMVNRRAIHLGLFPTREAAIEVRHRAELEHYGELCP